LPTDRMNVCATIPNLPTHHKVTKITNGRRV
jgi:hypothetical protein